jgi:hypothetical protein
MAPGSRRVGRAVTVGDRPAMLIGIFLSNFFPSVGGDVAKVYYLGKHHGYRPMQHQSSSIVFSASACSR